MRGWGWMIAGAAPWRSWFAIPGVRLDVEAETPRAFGCDEGQGWLFGRPLSSEAIIAMIQAEGRTGEEASACA